MLTVMSGSRKTDIMIKCEQRIRDVYQCLVENGYLLPVCGAGDILVYSVRQRAYVDPELTFSRGNVYNGDILRIE